jgi:hypothetical protein
VQHLRAVSLAAVAAALVLGAAVSARAQGPKSNLLLGKKPARSKGVPNAGRLTDGTAARDGSFWDTDLTARFTTPDAFVVYDLGSEQHVGAAWLQGDNNDIYELDVSADGEHFTPAWRAGPQPGAGLRARQSDQLDANGRYLRISASGGDGSYSLSEVQVFGQTPDVFPPPLAEAEGLPLGQTVRDTTLVFGLALMALVLLSYRGMPRWWLGVLLAAVGVAGLSLWKALASDWPTGTREVSLVRGVLAAVAAVAVAREALGAGHYPVQRRITGAVLGFCGLGAFAAFYNLCQPQFTDAGRHTSTFVHYYDLRQYYTTAKYFRELGYGGMFAADVAAYIEDTPGASVESMGNLMMRNLDTLRASTVLREKAAIMGSRARFSAERWEDFKSDSRALRQAMGTEEFMAMMRDHGANATPVWMALAHLLFSAVPPTHAGFTFTALFDLVLLAGMFAAIGRVFGTRTMWVCMVIFGANDFIMFGTNWAGSTLRHDWLAYLGFAACALKREKWVAGGALLALSTMIRAFPALAMVAAAIPALWTLWEHRRAQGRLPALAELRKEPIARVALGALASTALLFLFSIIVLPPGAWPEWLRKVAQLSSDAHTNHISLRTLLAGAGGDQADLLRARAPLFAAGAALITALVALAARGKRIEQAAMLGLVLVPTYLYPANYYIHIIFLLPLVAADAVVWIALLGLCASQYFTVLIADKAEHFYFATVLLFAAFLLMLGALVARQPFVARWLRSSPS